MIKNVYPWRRHVAVSVIALMAGIGVGWSQPVEKVLFIGDSITQHGPSVEKLGWSGDYGMAASSRENDYVHRFIALLAKEQGSAPEADVYARGGGRLPGQLKFLDDFRTSGAQIAVVQMGENDPLQGDGSDFQRDYESILEAIRSGNPECRIFCFGVWAPPSGNQKKDSMIREACAQYAATFVSLKTVYVDPRNKAFSEKRFTHPGVNWHPGDRGMQAMAERLWAAYQGKNHVAGDTDYAPIEWSFAEDWSGDLRSKWSPVPVVADHAAVLEQGAPGGAVHYQMELPVEQIKSGILLLKTRVKAEDISTKAKRWNGIKLMLRLQDAEGVMSYPQCHLPTGTFDWKPVEWGVVVPDNIVSAQLVIGLENVTGKATIGPIEISVREDEPMH